MKNIHQIFHSFILDGACKPISSRIQSRQDLERLKLILPLDMRAGLLRISYHAPKLLFCFNHPSHAYNFNHYKKKDIMSCLKAHPEAFTHFLAHSREPSMRHFLQKVSIQAYVPRGLLRPSVLPSVPNALRYHEIARGTFHNHATDPKLKEQFEELRKLMIRNYNADKQHE